MTRSRASVAVAPKPSARPADRDRVMVEVTVRRGESPRAIDLLAQRTALPKTRIKEAMGKGAVWLAPRGRKPARLRRVTTVLKPGERLAMYYNAAVLALEPPQAALLRDYTRYSIWRKPSGLLVEGSRYGDHATLSRQVELHFEQKRRVFLVHRLDREASGVILLAHTPQAAARLSALFRNREIEKEYCIEVKGDLRRRGFRGRIDEPIEGKPSLTEYEVIAHDPVRDACRVTVRMQTGRHHQIRRHFAHIGYPVMGDPKYGAGNSDPRGMQLVATALCFVCPWTFEHVEARVQSP